MHIGEYLPFWNKLTAAERAQLENAAVLHRFARGAMLHEGGTCTGLIVVVSGRVRAYMLSADGRELTLYRLLERDVCLLSASCALRGLDFDILLAAETDCDVFVIPADVYQGVMQQSAAAAAVTNELMAARFSDVMWLMDQLLYHKLDCRLAAFLVEERALSDSDSLSLTHERIAAHLGSAREVVTRLLKYFQGEGLVKLGRGSVTLLDEARLRALAGDSLR